MTLLKSYDEVQEYQHRNNCHSLAKRLIDDLMMLLAHADETTIRRVIGHLRDELHLLENAADKLEEQS